MYSIHPIPLWVHLGSYQPFVDVVKASMAKIKTNHNIVSTIIKKRYGQYVAGEFDRNIERWDIFGKRKHSLIHNILYAVYGRKLNVGLTMKKELNNIQQYIDYRTNWMKTIPFKGFKIQNLNLQFWVVVHFIPLILLTLIFSYLGLYLGLYNYISQRVEEKQKRPSVIKKKTFQNNKLLIF